MRPQRRNLACRIAIVGDSHVSFLSGVPGLQAIWPRHAVCAIPGIHTIRLGQFLAHSLTKPTHVVRRHLRDALAMLPKHTPVVLCFGEIDCRNHVVKRARHGRRTIESVASELAQRYVRSAVRLVTGRRLAFLSVPPATDRTIVNPEYPAVGTFEERSVAVQAFNQALSQQVERHGHVFLDVFTPFADAAAHPRPEYLPDGVHLGVRAIPHVIRTLVKRELLLETSKERASRQAAVSAIVKAGELAERALEREKKRIVPPPPPPPPLSTALGKPVMAALVDRAARACVDAGAGSIAIFGAGRHTRKIGLETFKRYGLRVAAILDDSPKHRTMMGVRLCQPTQPDLHVQAVVISSDVHEAKLTSRAREVFAGRDVPIIRIYTDEAA